MTKPRRLGRGLEALLGRPLEGGVGVEGPQTVAYPRLEQPEEAPAEAGENGIRWVGVYDIDRNPFQPRQDFDESGLQELAESLTAHGMLQPVVVRKHADRFQLVSGERRWRAATVAGWEKVPCQVWDADDRQMAELALVENIQRRDLNALEKAASFQHYLEQYQCTQEELAGRLKIDRSTIANLIRLLELPDEVQAAVRGGGISPGHARALLPLGDEREQIAFCRRIQAEGLSVRATEDLIRELIHAVDEQPLGVVAEEGPDAAKASRGTASRRTAQQISALEQDLRLSLGTKVDIRTGAKGRGKLVIHFKNPDEFERLRDLLAGTHPSARSQAS